MVSRIFSNLVFGMGRQQIEILLASTNEGKVREMSDYLPDWISLRSLNSIGFEGDIPETGDTLEENACQKASYLAHKVSMPILADDTGLMVPSLNYEPGVYSARYAGPEKSSEKNMDKLLDELKVKTDRSAFFRTVLAFYIEGELFTFFGEVHGSISFERMGNEGFGYDPIFIPSGETRSFGQMTLKEKALYSHRTKALEKFVSFITSRAISN